MKTKSKMSWRLLFFFLGRTVLIRGYYIQELPQRTQRITGLLRLKRLQKAHIYAFGSGLTEGFAKMDDAVNKPYFIQKFLHIIN